MAQMSMNRVIHSALRRDLARFDTALGAFVEGDSRRAEQLWTAWVNFDDQLTTHHLGEHDIVWPTLRQLGMKGRPDHAVGSRARAARGRVAHHG